MFISPVAKTTTIATTTTGETSHHQTHEQVSKIFSHICWIHVNSYSGSQHNLWDFIQEKSLLRQKVWPTIAVIAAYSPYSQLA